MCEGGTPKKSPTESVAIMTSVVNQNESDETRRSTLLKEIEKFSLIEQEAAFPCNSLDPKSRDNFQPLFSTLKTYLYECQE